MIFLWGECTIKPHRWFVNVRLGNGVVLTSGNKPLPGPMLTQIYVAIWCHYATMWWYMRSHLKLKSSEILFARIIPMSWCLKWPVSVHCVACGGFTADFNHVWVRSWNCGCLVTWFCYQLIAKPGNKTAAVPWLDPYRIGLITHGDTFINGASVNCDAEKYNSLWGSHQYVYISTGPTCYATRLKVCFWRCTMTFMQLWFIHRLLYYHSALGGN